MKFQTGGRKHFNEHFSFFFFHGWSAIDKKNELQNTVIKKKNQYPLSPKEMKLSK